MAKSVVGGAGLYDLYRRDRSYAPATVAVGGNKHRPSLVAIVEQKLVFSISGQRFPQLLQSPLGRRMFRGIEMNQPSRTDLQRHKYINHAKANRHYGEEITSYDRVGVIFQEGGPALVS